MPGPAFLRGDAVVLRTVEEADLELLQAQVNDPRIWRPIGRSRPMNHEEEREFFENEMRADDTVYLLIAVDSTPVGRINFDSIDWEAKTAEIGYWIAPEHQEKRYGLEAVELLVAYGFDQLGLHKIAARVFAFNEASKRLVENAGFSQEGIHRDDEFIDGEYHDAYWYGLLESEWSAERELISYPDPDPDPDSDPSSVRPDP